MEEYCEIRYIDSDNRGIKFILLSGQSNGLASVIDQEECFDSSTGKTGNRSLDSDLLQVLATRTQKDDFEVGELDERYFVHNLVYSLSGADTTEIMEALETYSNEEVSLTEVRGYLNDKLTLISDSGYEVSPDEEGEPDDGELKPILDEDDLETISLR